MFLKLSGSALSLRSITKNDERFLLSLYSSTREAEMKQLTGWTSEQKYLFCLQQFNAQHTYYQHHYRGSDFWIIQENGDAIGRLYVKFDFNSNSIRIIDITLDAACRNKGIGTSILNDIIDFATTVHKSVSIHVESFNPALGLYEKLGFNVVDKTNGVYYLMEWNVNKAVAGLNPIMHT